MICLVLQVYFGNLCSTITIRKKNEIYSQEEMSLFIFNQQLRANRMIMSDKIPHPKIVINHQEAVLCKVSVIVDNIYVKAR